MKKIALLIVCLLTIGHITTEAQDKTGYVNFGNVVQLMPDVESANEKLQKTRDSLITAHEQRMKAFEEKFARYQKKAAEGELSRVKIKEKEAELQKEQQELRNSEQMIQQKIQQRRSQLMAPIVNKVQTAINEIGEEGDYTMIFDTSLGAVLHAAESEDLTEKVKAKLNLNEG